MMRIGNGDYTWGPCRLQAGVSTPVSPTCHFDGDYDLFLSSVSHLINSTNP